MSQEAPALAGSQATVSLGDVLACVAERLQARFTALVHDLPLQTAENRPTPLLQFLHDARQQLLRAAALVHDTRKLPPLTQLVQPGGVLDIAATHARALQTTADELFGANDSLRWARVQLFNVPDALDVLSTGTYSSLPAAIHDMRGPLPAEEPEQQLLLNQLNHLLYAHLLKAHLPEALQLVEVRGGYAVLRCPGLYEVQLSLQQLPYPVQVAEAQQAAKEAAEAAVAAAAAGAAQDAQQKGTQQQAQPGQQQQHQQKSSAAAGEDAPAKPEVRWQWKLTHLVVLPNAGNRQPLQPEQRASLTFHLQQNMWAAADAAAVEAAKREGAAEGGQPLPAAGAAGKGEPSNPATAAAASQPAMSGMASTRSGPAASTLSGVSGAQDVAGRGLQLDLYGADEISLPLRLMHAVLRDVAARILLREVETAASQLAAVGSKWHTHLKPRPAEKLKPGVCLLYWQQAPALLSLPDAAAEAAAEAAAGQAGRTAGGTADKTAAAAADRAPGAAASKLGQPSKAAEAYPGIEVGTSSDGTIQQLHVPVLQLPGSQQLLEPMLDTHTVDIVGLLLQGVQVIVANQLQFLQAAIQQRQQQELGASKEQQGPDGMLQLRLCRYGHLASSAQRQQQQQGQLIPQPQQAAAAVTAGLSHLSEDQQQQQQLLQQLPDTLEVWVEGQSAVTVAFQPWSGRLILRPGSAYGGDCNIDMGMSLHQHQEVLRSRQDRLFQQLQQQLLARSSGTVTVGQHQQAVVLPCLWDLASGLSDLCDELVLKQRYTNLVTAARMLSLQHSHHLRGFLLAGQQLRLTQAAGAAGKVRTARSLRQIYLSMPSLQLPSYMLLLARGAWCGAAADLQQQQQQLGQQEEQPTGAPASRRLVPAQLATLNPVLCMSFPRQHAGNADVLLLVLNNTQGLAGPLLKELRLPSQQQAALDALPASAADGAAGAGGARKRQRDEFEGLQQQQQQQQQQQMQSPPRQVDCLPQLTAAVEYSRARLTYERLCLELTALQVSFVEVRLPAAAVSQGPGAVSLQQAWGSPSIQVLSVPGVQLFQQLQRPCGCSPAAVGLHEVWIVCGPEPGRWCVELSGSVYHQQQQQSGAAEGGPLWRWQYDFAAGDDVRAAMLQLQRLLYMQQFLNRLEALACGQQQLTVLQCCSTAAGKAAMAAAAGEDGINLDRPIKKARRSKSELEKQQQLLPDGLGAGLANGPSSGLPLNGMLQQQQQQLPDSNGQLGSLSNGLRAGAGANGHAVSKSAGSSSGGGAACGLLWHWPGTGLVRLAGYSRFEAVLQCSKPLDDPQAATVATAGGVQASSGLQQQQQLPPSRVQFHVCWQPKYGFGAKPQETQSVQPSVGPWGVAQGAVGYSGAGTGNRTLRRTWPSSSNSTTWLYVHSTQRPQQQQQQRQAGGTGESFSAPPEAVSAEDVLNMGCCISCSSSNVPDVLLSELASMADTGCEDLLLDAVTMLGWPLSQMQLLLSDSEPARVGTLLARAAKKAADTAAAAAAGAAAGGSSSAAAAAAAAGVGGSGWWPSVVSSCPTGSWQQLRVTIGAEAAEPLTVPQQQQQQQKAEQQQGEGSKAREGPRLRCELLLDLCVVSGGRVKLTVRHLDTAGGRRWQAAITAINPQAEGSAAAAAAATVPEAAAQYASKVVAAALQHLQKTQPKVCCRPTFGATTWQRQIVPQFDKTPPAAAGAAEVHAGRREPLSGLYLLVKDLQPVLDCLVEAWTYHVCRTAAAAATAAEKARSAAAAAAAAAASSEAGQAAGTAAAAAAPPAGQQPQQQQQPGQAGSGQQQGQVQVKPEQQQQVAQGQVMQPQQQAALQQAAAKALAQQQQQQQQVRPQMPQVSQAQTATMYAASAAPMAAVAGTVQAMTLQVPGSMPMAAAGGPRPVAVVPLPQQQPQVLLSMPGMQYQMMPGGAAMMGVQPTAWAVMQGVPQQQHPAQQQQQHH